MKKLSLFIAICLITLMVNAQSKSHVLKGKVKDAQGNPIEKAKVVNLLDTNEYSLTDKVGMFVLQSANSIKEVEIRKSGIVTQRVRVAATFMEATVAYEVPKIRMKEEKAVQIAFEAEQSIEADAISYDVNYSKRAMGVASNTACCAPAIYEPIQNVESYSEISENDFHYATTDPLSTFSIDVDRASYSNMRRFINMGQLPPKDAVRIEELINYFEYDYDATKGTDPVNIYTEVSQAPWNKEHQLLQIGIKARELDKESLPPSNIVFLIDVSGSMNAPNKLPLLKSSMKMLAQQMRKEDKVAIVVYAGAAGLVLEPTSGDDKQKIYQAIDNLNAGGSTAGGAGIQLAYKVAADYQIKDGNNRVVLATDGDFNVGAASDADMEKLIVSKRDQGVFLTVLGFGMGNYKDSKMEVLADKGNGNYAYIDNITEAKKTLVNEFGGTMFAVAKDVKIQVEFNPANVAEYRLIGYENRMLNKEDFNNDKKDAGEMGVGHVVTALYEIVPVGASSNRVDPLKYQKQVEPTKQVLTDELATVKLRYKEPDGDKSKLMSEIVKKSDKAISNASENLRWSASVAQFGMLLRDSEHIGEATYASVIKLAEGATGKDVEGYRRECVQLMKSAELLDKSNTASR
ncbi:MAG: VWA domain-containing protein [Flavobacteriales bacterium]